MAVSPTSYFEWLFYLLSKCGANCEYDVYFKPSSVQLSSSSSSQRKKPIRAKHVFALLALVFLILFLAILITYLVSKYSGKDKDDAAPGVCTTEECTLAAAHLLSYMDQRVSPCDDFHKFVCGRYAEKHEITAGKVTHDIFSVVGEQGARQIKQLVEDDPVTELEAWDMVVTMYHSCMNQEALDNLGAQPLLADLDSTPLYIDDGQFNSVKQPSWEKLTLSLLKKGYDTPMPSVGVSPDLLDIETKILRVSGIELPLDTEVYTEPIQRKKDIYRHFMEVTFEELGNLTKEQARKMADELMTFDEALSKVEDWREKVEEKEDRDGSTIHYEKRITTMGKVKKNFPNIDWETLLSIYPSEKVSDDAKVHCDQEYTRNITNVFEKFSPRIIHNSIMRHILTGSLGSLSAKYKAILDEYKREMQGKEPTHERWKFCVSQTVNSFPWIVGRAYVMRYFDESAKLQMKDLISRVKTVLYRTIKNADWMDDETKHKAILKADTLVQKIGYPDRIHNMTWLMREYRPAPELHNNTFFANVRELSKAKLRLHLKEAWDPIDRKDWLDTPTTVNAYYSPVLNEIAFPAGILQFPFFMSNAPSYFNYGRIGMVIGHELTHGYDSSGRRFNEQGNLEDWWQNETLKEFQEKAQCFRDQFSAILDPETEVYLNGNETVTENIADTGGLVISYQAYKDLDEQSQSLPGLTSFTDDQLFFVAEASTWCELTKIEIRHLLVRTAEHSLGRYRSNVPLQNNANFASAFNCPLGSPMNPMKKCKLW